jgi:protein gp37
MGANTEIGWTDHSWPVHAGCKEVSPGCMHCYAALLTATRLSKMPKYEGLAVIGENGKAHFTGEVRMWREHLVWPLKWRKPSRIFVDDMSDLFYNGVPDGEVLDVFRIIAECPRHTFQILTKRADRMAAWFKRWRDVEPTGVGWTARMERGPANIRLAHPPGRAHLFAEMIEGWGVPPDGAAYPLYDWMEGMRWWPDFFQHVELGVSVEDRKHGLPRIDILREIPAALRFLSIEPLLEDLGEINLKGIGWVVIGGESGHSARPFQITWARDILRQCRAAGVPVFVKQVGANAYGEVAGEFSSHATWVAKAQSWIGGTGAACVDATGRPMRRGADFARADREGTFPVRFHLPLATTNRKGTEQADWPADLRVREFPLHGLKSMMERVGGKHV